MIFPSVKIDSVVQVEDRFRIDLEGSKTHDGTPIDKIEIRPMVGMDPIIVFDSATNKESMHLDWQYPDAGVQVILIDFYSGNESKEISRVVNVITAQDDKLFSNDEMLLKREPSVLNLLPEGRSSFNHVHRLAQEEILRDLSELGIEASKETVMAVDDASRWSSFLTLAFIFESNIASVQDVHAMKKKTYQDLAADSRKRAIIKLDTNNDGEEDEQVSASRTYPTSLRRA